MKYWKHYIEEVGEHTQYTYDWYSSLDLGWSNIANYCIAASGLLKSVNPHFVPIIVAGDNKHTGSIMSLVAKDNRNEYEECMERLLHKTSRLAVVEESKQKRWIDEGFTHMIMLGRAAASSKETKAISILLNKTKFKLSRHKALNTHKTMVLMSFNGTIVHEASHSIYDTRSHFERLLKEYANWRGFTQVIEEVELACTSHQSNTMNGIAKTHFVKGIVDDVAMESWIQSSMPNLFPFIRGKNLINFNSPWLMSLLKDTREREVNAHDIVTAMLPAVKKEPTLQDVLTHEFYEEALEELYLNEQTIEAISVVFSIANKVRHPLATDEERSKATKDILEYLDSLKDAGHDYDDVGESVQIAVSMHGDSEEESEPMNAASEDESEDIEPGEELTSDELEHALSQAPEMINEQVNRNVCMVVAGDPTEIGTNSLGSEIIRKVTYVVNGQGEVDLSENVPVFMENPPKLEEYDYSDELVDTLDTNFGRLLSQVNVQRTRYGDYNATGGRIVPHRIARAASDGAIFGRKVSTKRMKIDYNFFVLIDTSGSMDSRYYGDLADVWETRFEAAFGVAWALWKSLAEVRKPCHIYSHMSNATGWHGVDERSVKMGKIAVPSMTREAVRNNIKLYMGVTKRGSQIYRDYDRCFWSDNMDGYAINHLAKRVILPSKLRGQKVLIVISDGAPSASGYWGSDAIDHTKEAAEFLRKNGVIVKSLSIDSSCTRSNNRIYGEQHNKTADVEGLIDIAREITGLT